MARPKVLGYHRAMGRCGLEDLDRRWPRAACALLLLGGTLGCAGQKEEQEPSTDACVPYCERRQQAGCNELGGIANCKLACGLLVSDPSECGAASKALLDCRLAQPNICRGCSAEQERVNALCSM